MAPKNTEEERHQEILKTLVEIRDLLKEMKKPVQEKPPKETDKPSPPSE